MRQEVPLWEKANLTLEEAALYSGIGQGKLRGLTNDEDCPFVLWNGSKRLLKRRKLDEKEEKIKTGRCCVKGKASRKTVIIFIAGHPGIVNAIV